MVGQQTHPAGAVGGASPGTAKAAASSAPAKSGEQKAQEDLKVDAGQPSTNIQVISLRKTKIISLSINPFDRCHLYMKAEVPFILVISLG